ncbi:hypothetical protein KJ786_00185 [Patescibacteria group bacterium]|nr:hypothetical protein [Patescibacteria group bacterium]
MDKDIQKFFELYVGYDGKEWNEAHAKRHQQNVSSYFLYDMNRMIKEQVGYPSILYLLNIVAFFGYCINFDTNWSVPSEAREKNNEFERVGKADDFEFFCVNYLSKMSGNYKNKDFISFLFNLIRHRLSHSFFVHNFITTLPDGRHLQIQDKSSETPHVWLSVSCFFEDTKKAIENIYQELEADKNKAQQFAEKQKFILEWTWKLQTGILKNINQESTTITTNTQAIPADTNVSGSCYTPPQFPPKEIL